MQKILSFLYVKERIPKGSYNAIIEKTSQILYMNNIPLNIENDNYKILQLLKGKSNQGLQLDKMLYDYSPEYSIAFITNENELNIEAGDNLEMFRRNINRFLCELLGYF